MAEKKINEKAEKNASKKKSRFKAFFSRTKKFFRSCFGELKKISWPTPMQTTKNFGVVLAVIFIVGLFIFALDRGLYALLGLIMNISAT